MTIYHQFLDCICIMFIPSFVQTAASTTIDF